MNQTTSIKPEPIKAKPNWSYQEYYLSQLQRHKASNNQTSSPAKSPTEASLKLEAEERNRVIAKMEELAASVGIRITITIASNPSAV